MKEELYFASFDQKTQIHYIKWVPDGEVKAILQISHGMVEHIGRYDRFARYLNESGILVVGNDHLGHGKSVIDDSKLGFFAEPNGNECLLRDIHKLRELTQAEYPGVPYFVLGHSMGSFLIRQYITMHGEGLAGAIVMGTGFMPGIVPTIGKLVCRITALFKGWEYRSDAINGIVLGANNKRFAPCRTAQDWLSKDEKSVDAYRASRLCTFVFTLNGFYHMFDSILYLSKKKYLQGIPKKLPILVVSGDSDPIGDFGKGVKMVYEEYLRAGIQNVQLKLYENDRHEILNETDYLTVYADLANWMSR